MTWFILALISAAADAAYYALVKKYVRGIDQFTLASGIFFMTAFFTMPILFIYGMPRLNYSFWLALLGTVSLNFLASILIYSSLKSTDLSLVAPTKALTPIFLLLTSFIMLRELPNWFGVLGVLAIVVGSYVLHSVSRPESVGQFVQRVWQTRGVRYMFFVAAIFSVTANFDKMVVQNSSPIFALFATTASLGIIFFAAGLYRQGFSALATYIYELPIFCLVGFISAGGGLAINIALSQQIVPYVISLKRFSTVFGVFIGWWFFHEKNIPRRLVGAGIMLAGSVCLIMWG